MKMPYLVTAAIVLMGFVLAAPAAAQDRIERIEGSTLSGTIKAMSSQTITIETRSGEEKIGVNEIERVRFDKEPAEFNLARSAALSGRYEDALADFEKQAKTTFEGARVLELKQDLQFYLAFCYANLAFSDQKPVAEAEKLLAAFVKDNSSNYHFLEANELLGNLRTAAGKYAEAEQAYDELAKSQIEAIKLKGLVLKGYVLLKQGKTEEALKSFELVAATKGEGPGLQQQVWAGMLGKAACLAASGKSPEGAAIAQKVIDEAPQEGNGALYARAYNTLGNALLKGNKKKEAMIAFLHVDVLYSSYQLEHAEALYNLAKLYRELNPQGAEAGEFLALLKERYATTTWAKEAQ